MTRVVETIAQVRDLVAELRAAGARVALVPTMGALHAGHLALVRRAGEVADVAIVSIFVNPLQFGPGEDLERYPRMLEADLRTLAPLEVAGVFAPPVAELYPPRPCSAEPTPAGLQSAAGLQSSGGQQSSGGRQSSGADTRVTAGHVATLFEGATRPGHFDGVLTVVSKLLNIVQPDVVLFGQKDAQQVFLVKRMLADLNVPVAVEVVPIVREDGGLALSSRNRYLSAEQKQSAMALSASLAAAAASAPAGRDTALAAAQGVVSSEQSVKLDYFAIVAPDTFLPVAADFRGPALAILAAYVGTTRLIDNRLITLG
jgi:pantoate--beta-alanine ligase